MEDNNQKNKIFLGMLVGSIVTAIAVLITITVILAISQKRLNQDLKTLQQEQYLQQQVDNTQGEPTDIPPVSQTEQTTQNIQGEPTDIPPVTQNTQSQSTNIASANIPPATQNTQGTNQTKNNLISMNEAKQIAINALGGGQVISQENDTYTDDLDDVPTYKFDIRFNNRVYEIEVNAINGTVYDFERD